MIGENGRNLSPKRDDSFSNLTRYSQWVLWRLEEIRDPKTGTVRSTKIPRNVRTGRKASATNPDTWSTYAEAMGASRGQRDAPGGLGFVLSPEDPFSVIDLDHCVSETGEIAPQAREYVRRLNSYMEFSPSGRGLHIWVNGRLPSGGRVRKLGVPSPFGPGMSPAIEMYDQGRYITVTGHHLPGTPVTIEPRQAELDALHRELFPSRTGRSGAPPQRTTSVPPPRSDGEILDAARRSDRSGKFGRLWEGRWQEAGYHSQSEADLALCALLCAHTSGSRALTDRLFRQSGLMRAKWDERRGERTYGERTLDKALAEKSGRGAAPLPHDAPSERSAGTLKWMQREGTSGRCGYRTLGGQTSAEEEQTRVRRATERKGTMPLWEQWVAVLETDEAKLIWTDREEAYFQLPSAELFAVRSERGALYFQERTNREAYHGSEKWARAAGALCSWIREHGTRAQVFRGARAEWAIQILWIGCEDERSLYRITPGAIERLPNGTDGVLILNGAAPVQDEIIATGELSRWLEQTWAVPEAKLILAVYVVMLILGATSYDARPLLIGTGPKGSGKTTTLQTLGKLAFKGNTIAQMIRQREEQNESRIVNELFTIFDNLETPPRSLPVADFLATACTQQVVSIRKMRVEGEVVEKPITAFVAVTSFTLPPCLQRSDLTDRALVCPFQRPDGARVAKMRERAPDRQAVWSDLLLLLQRVVQRWPEVPKDSEHRCIEFMQFAHALLGPEPATALERYLLARQASTTGLDDPIQQKLEENPPIGPMTAAELLDFWWATADPDRPRNAHCLGTRLRGREGRLGNWLVVKGHDEVKNCSLWSFSRAARAAGLTPVEALAQLRCLVPPGERVAAGEGTATPAGSGPSPTQVPDPVPEMRSGYVTGEGLTARAGEREDADGSALPLRGKAHTAVVPSPDLRHRHRPAAGD